MTEFSLLVLLSLVGHNGNLLGLAVLNCLGSNGCTLNIGSADLDSVVTCNCNNLVENNFAVAFYIKLFDKNNIASTLYCFPPVSIIAYI